MKEEESGNHGKRKWKVEYVRERERGKRNEEEEEEEKLKEKKMTKKEEEDGGGRNEEDEEEGGAARDLEMRDVRRDGLIEAFLIAFTPLHGLLYPRYIQYQSYVADPHHIRPWLLLLPPPFLSLSLFHSSSSSSPPLLFAPFSPFAFLFCIPCFIHLDLPPPPSIFIGDRVSPVQDPSIITSVYTLYTHCVKFLVNIETGNAEK